MANRRRRWLVHFAAVAALLVAAEPVLARFSWFFDVYFGPITKFIWRSLFRYYFGLLLVI